MSTSKKSDHIKTEANVAYAPVVGFGRDTILNLLPGQRTQENLSTLLSPAFGEGFQLWNSRKEAVPFHVTISQTNLLNAVLDNIHAQSEELQEANALTFCTVGIRSS